ncbi:MAG: hypothetical protein Q7R80_01825, partial [bacterium]|nr:hypothetical protein [bacterium]
REAAQAYGATGVAARASGWDRDVRRDFPYAAYNTLAPRIITENAGDVHARFLVRVRELEITAKLIERIVRDCPSGAYAVPCTPTSGMGMSAVESWRGEILTVLSMEKGLITRCFPRDPSFCNWALFGELAPGNIVPDFPLCNKSLNLSYAGNDL